MTIYLQRLLDRAAGIAPAPARPGLSPAIGSGSPILRFDQRLGDPALAGDYAIPGASLPEPDHGEDGPPVAAPAPIPRRQDMAAPPRFEMPVAAADGPPVTGEAPVPAREAVRTTAVPAPPDPIEYPQTRPTEPVEGARLQAKAGKEGDPPTPAAHAPMSALGPDPTRLREAATEAETSIRRLHDEVREVPAMPPSPDQPVMKKPVPSTPPVAAPAVVPSLAAEPAAATSTDRVAAPPTAEAQLTPPAAAPPAEPIRPVAVEPPPLESPAPGPSAREIARLVEEAVRKALPGTESRPPGPPETDQAKPAPKPEAANRPATAAEASVIGKLERSSFSPMLFGVRRR